MNSLGESPIRHHLRSSSSHHSSIQTPPLNHDSFNPNTSSDHHHLNTSNNSVLDWAAWTDQSPVDHQNNNNNNNNNHQNNNLNNSVNQQGSSDTSMEGNNFLDPFSSTLSLHDHNYSGLGMDVDGDRSLSRLAMLDEVENKSGGSTKRVRTRLQTRTTMSPTPSHPYVLSSPISPASSRFFTKEMLTDSPPILTNYSTVYPSPFRQNSASSLATMDPSHSVRSISPSETESVATLGSHSRMGSVSGASSVFDGDYGSSVVDLGASIRSFSESPQKVRRPALSRRDSSSPKKTKRPGKLTNAERKKICLHREAFPETRQDTIGDKFGVERSTISKILKNKERWLALPSDDEEETSPIQSSPVPSLRASKSHKSTFNPILSLSIRPSASTASSPGGGGGGGEKGKTRGGGRYPDLDEKLSEWVRCYVGSGSSLTDDVIISRAKEIAKTSKGCDSFKASPAWLDRFKIRVGIVDGAISDIIPVVVIDTEEEELDSTIKLEFERDNNLGNSIRASFNAVSSSSIRSPRDSKRKRHSMSAATTRRPLSMSMSTSPLPTTLEQVSTPPREFHQDTESTPTRTRRGVTESKSEQTSTLEEFGQEDDLVSSLRSARTPPTRRHNSLSQSHSSSLSTSSFQSADGSPSHYPFSYPNGGIQLANSAYSFQEQPYPLQSPFQATAQSFFPHHATSGSTSTSGANSPGGSYQHNRSGSTASTTSSYSGLTAFSSQNGPGTPLSGSHYGSFSTAQSSSTSGSLPSTPATGYFGHGPNGTQSQLQAVFVQEQYAFPGFTQPQGQSQPLSQSQSQPGSNQLVRRATISGSTPYNSGGSTPSTRANQDNLRSQSSTTSSSSINGSEVSFDQAYASLQTALEYLSTNGNGYVSAVDLVVLSDLRAKMDLRASPAPKLAAPFTSNPANSSTVSELRLKMERSSANLSSGIRTRGQGQAGANNSNSNNNNNAGR